MKRFKLASILLFVFLFLMIGMEVAIAKVPESKAKSYAMLPFNTQLDAVKWTDGFWNQSLNRVRTIYLPGIIDGSYLKVDNASSFRNFLRAAGMEQGGPLGRPWTDGDCYLILDAASRLYAYQPDDYLKSKLEYWIPVIAKIQKENGLVDSWTILKKYDEGSPWKKYDEKYNWPEFSGTIHYNIGHLYTAATSYKNATGNDSFLSIADKALNYSVDAGVNVPGGMMWNAVSSGYSTTGDARYLNYLKTPYLGNPSLFGPPFVEANEVFGHNTASAHLLMGATVIYNYTNDKVILEALKRLADNLLNTKLFITGATGPIFHGERPELTVNGKTYPKTKINMSESIGKEFELPNDNAYCESCGQCLFMEFFYTMFRLTGESKYMDAAERMLYNTTSGCVAIDQPNFFYCNPQEQLPDSKRYLTAGTDTPWEALYTWKRQYTSQCTCCPPKVLRAIAMTAEIAYNLNDQGLWVNLYGSNVLQSKLPWGGAIKCTQTSAYPWDGKVTIAVNEVESEKEFKIFFRVPEWVKSPVNLRLNGKIIEKAASVGSYYSINRKWKKGDQISFELPMPVRLMASDPRVKDNLGKVSVMRGPIVYCLEDQDIPEGLNLDAICITGEVNLKPVFTKELGGITKLTGSLDYRTNAVTPVEVVNDFKPEKGLYQEIKLPENVVSSKKMQKVQISMIPFYARLNREGNYFKVWLPVGADKTN